MPKHPRYTRLHHHLLGPPHSPRTHPERDRLQGVTLLPPVLDFLTSLLSDPVPPQSGLLFGQFSGSALQVNHAVPGERGLMATSAAPFRLNLWYALGWADAIAALSGLEWVGMWVVYGHRTPLDRREVEAYLLLAYDQGLVDSEAIVLVAGWLEGRLAAEALQMTDGGIVRFPAEIPESAP